LIKTSFVAGTGMGKDCSSTPVFVESKPNSEPVSVMVVKFYFTSKTGIYIPQLAE
jgi:hypothetical protein